MERLQAEVRLHQEELAALVLDPAALEQLLERGGGRPGSRPLWHAAATARGDVGQALEALLEAEAIPDGADEVALQPLQGVPGREDGRLGFQSPPQPPEAVVEGRAHEVRIASSRASATSLPRVPASPAGPTQEGQPSRQGQAAMSERLSASSRECSRYSGSERPMPPG